MTTPLTRDLSASSLLSRRSIAVSTIDCNVENQCTLTEQFLFPPEKDLQIEKAAPVLVDRSPMAGSASLALLGKRRQRRDSAAVLTCPSKHESNDDPTIAEVGFHRIVYQKIRQMRDERFGTSYKSLKDACLDVMHAVRVCSQAMRFISYVRAGTVSEELVEPMPPLGDTTFRSTEKLANYRLLRKTSSNRSLVANPAPLLQSDELLDRKWLSLLDGLSPMTPQVHAWLLRSPNLLKPLSNEGKGMPLYTLHGSL